MPISTSKHVITFTIEYRSEERLLWNVLVSGYWKHGSQPPLEKLKASVEDAGKKSIAQARENELVVQETHGSEAIVYYFSLTDREEKPGEYLYMTQGAARVGELSILFTILSNKDRTEIDRTALEVIRTATLSLPPSAGPAQSIQITDAPGAYSVTIPDSRLTMTIPKGSLVRQSDSLAGFLAHGPRYFYFEDLAMGLVVSGWFEPAKAFSGLARIDHRFGNEGDFGRPERFSERFAIDPVQVE